MERWLFWLGCAAGQFVVCLANGCGHFGLAVPPANMVDAWLGPGVDMEAKRAEMQCPVGSLRKGDESRVASGNTQERK